MDRMACLNLPVFPVQLLLRRHPDWKNLPVAVVDADKPQGMILWVNERARSSRILPGMRYAAGLSLAGSLRGGVVPKREIDKAVGYLSKRLLSFSPRVEPAVDEPGIFWIDASGLETLFGSLTRWAQGIRTDMGRAGFRTVVVVGFNRFSTYALAKWKQGIVLLSDPEEERIAARRVPLDRLAFEPETRDTLKKLGIKTVGRFIDLPPEGIAKRFRQGAHRLHKLASGQLQLPFQSERPQPPAGEELTLDYPETDIERLMVVIQRLLNATLQTLADRAHALTEVLIRFRFERLGEHKESIRPAEPTLDAAQLLDLIRLRLQVAQGLPDGVVEIALEGRSEPARPRQHQLLGPQPKRDLDAANRALARVRAELGDDAVGLANLNAGHLPEGSFTWEPLDSLTTPKPHNVDKGRLVRRIYRRPIPLQSAQRQEPEGWFLSPSKQGPVVNMFGPYIVSGGWWKRQVHREYYFAETEKGELNWVYYDQTRRRWFLQGRVE